MPKTPVSQRWHIVGWVAFSALLIVIGFVGTGLVLLSPRYLKARVEHELSDRLGLDVTMETMALSLTPRLRVSGNNLVFRVPAHPELPPFISIESLWVDVGLLSGVRQHVGLVHLEGLRIAVPPGDARDGLSNAAPTADDRGRIVVDHLETRDAVLTLLRRDPSKAPLLFKIRKLDVLDVGFGRSMPFTTELINPVPEGLVHSKGLVGPWQKSNPSALPVSGTYMFTLANLDTIDGIGGTLASDGTYAGALTAIVVDGRSTTPNFNLDLGGAPVPLDTTFKAIVDGSDGSTELEHVDATLFNTSLNVRGAIDNLPGPGRHDIRLNVQIDKGRIEDLLRLAINGAPFISGDVRLKAAVSLPPGKQVVRDRLRLSGRFDLARGRFKSGDLQAKIAELSRRGQGKDKDEAMTRVASALSGTFAIANGVVRLEDLTFAVPGAVVALDGTYGLESTDLDFIGTLRLQAAMSQVVGGFKSMFIKPFDRLFRRPDAGAVVPIKIGGTIAAPKLGVRVGKVLSRSEP